MRIRTLDGPPLPAEIAANTARLLALVELNNAQPQPVRKSITDSSRRVVERR